MSLLAKVETTSSENFASTYYLFFKISKLSALETTVCFGVCYSKKIYENRHTIKLRLIKTDNKHK